MVLDCKTDNSSWSFPEPGTKTKGTELNNLHNCYKSLWDNHLGKELCKLYDMEFINFQEAVKEQKHITYLHVIFRDL